MDTFTLVIVILGILLALAFNFSNGRNDASNVVATVVATRALTPKNAVLLASICCFAGPFIFSTAVAKTIGKGIVNPEIFTPILLLIGLCGAVFWVNFCSRSGIPVSSSHSLVGGLMGAGIAAGGIFAVNWPTAEMAFGMVYYLILGAVIGAILMLVIALISKSSIKMFLLIGGGVGAIVAVPIAMIVGIFAFSGLLAIVLFICVSPILGLVVSYSFTQLLTRITAKRSSHPMLLNKWFQRAQILASGFQATSLGGNDAQNAMGIIFAILISTGFATSSGELPLWVILLSGFAIAAGILSGGWKVIKKMGSGITRIQPYQGFSAAVSGGIVLSFMTSFGVPVSTTHVASGTIMGTGVTRGVGAVNWGNVRQMVTAWIITIPCSAAVSFLAYVIVALIFGF
ncbi:MAG TPA: inorganic phosphate transporter [Methanocorpusculum sp.]|nr:inorganic phosphate transporter [Methanocorpusculum sp.]HJJ53025.1 inorganic phosphate transporter [Methanocorpusculum sp.]